MTPLGDFAVIWQSNTGISAALRPAGRPQGGPVTASLPADSCSSRRGPDAGRRRPRPWCGLRSGSAATSSCCSASTPRTSRSAAGDGQYGLGTRSAPRAGAERGGQPAGGLGRPARQPPPLPGRAVSTVRPAPGAPRPGSAPATGCRAVGPPSSTPRGTARWSSWTTSAGLSAPARLPRRPVSAIGLTPQTREPDQPPLRRPEPRRHDLRHLAGAGLTLRAAFFDGAWSPLGDLHPRLPADRRRISARGGRRRPGNLLVAWTSGGSRPLSRFHPPPPRPRRQQLGVYAQRFQSPACAAGSASLCLRLGDAQRFSVQVSWKNPYTGETGTGKSAPLTGDTGAFWFFDPANLELMIKVLDGRAVNGNFWVFYGSLSNVEYTVTVTDAVFGTRRPTTTLPSNSPARRTSTLSRAERERCPPPPVPVPAPPAPRPRHRRHLRSGRLHAGPGHPLPAEPLPGGGELHRPAHGNDRPRGRP